ncbi:zinc finger, C3HC4 type [Ancylostoma caninum]|uniref:Zinc finger, C3HC4 type n=1 Tax=Ancylostoma caninum TaxID=29170 RepID=A0A368HAM0_ANCCA|nr:zinc finger, C3HC4 type [Ancylostoma caninum]
MSKYWRYRILTNQPCEDDMLNDSTKAKLVLDDPSDFRVPRSSSAAPRITSASNPTHEPAPAEPPAAPAPQVQNAASSTSSNFETLRFHQMTGRHVSLNTMRNMASRCSSEYTQGYVFSERPIRNNEKVVIEVVSVQQLYKGGLAFGVTCCDPSTLRSTDLPDDSSDLIEMPQYWVGIKDIALQPRVNTVLSFWITDAGEVKFEKDQGVARTVLHVDNSLPLYMYFDLYGSTQAIKLRGTMPVSRSHSPLPRSTSSSTSAPTRVALPPLPTMIRRESPALPSSRPSQPYEFSSNILRVLLRDEANGTAGVPLPNLLDDDFDENNASSRTRPVLPPRRGIDEAVLRRTVDDLLTDAPPVAAIPRPPPLAPRPTPLLGPLPAPPSRPPPPTPTATGSSLSTGGTSTSLHSASSALDSLLGRPSGTSQDLPSSSRSSLPNLQSLSASSATRAKSAQLSAGRESSDREEGPQGDDTDECTVCMSARVNSALYKCGHSCMCYDCAMQTYRSSGLCPLCRASIMDVIKIFKA